jgi:guanosine-3',5'-bis(diphosphate) 3'-pyrophosphohydrolase
MSSILINDYVMIIEAINFAARAHKDQRRKGDGNSPYINHLIEVLTLLSSSAKVTDPNILMAAVLHDILEDTEVAESELIDKFGTTVASYVLAVSDDKTMSLNERRDKQLKSMDKTIDPIKFIKLADHCSNVASIPPKWDKQRVKEYIEWSHSVAEKCFIVSKPLADIYKHRYLQAHIVSPI